MRELTVGSCFSGIGGLELGLEWTGGFETKWQIEIDPYATKILKKHWPNVKRYDDIAKIDPKRIERVNLISGGFPCQDISISNSKGVGLAGERSGLFFDLMRIADFLSPDWLLLENVPNLLSINEGKDFETIIETITGYSCLRPGNGWKNSGIAIGPKRSLAWRMFDAQYFGVAQRRRRVFIVASPRREAPFKVLFDEESGSRNYPPVQTVDEAGLCLSTRDGERQDPTIETLVCSTIGSKFNRDSFDGTQLIANTIRSNKGDDGSPFKAGGENPVAQTPGASQRGNTSFVWQDTHIAETVREGAGNSDGVSHWIQRCRCLGNAVVPQVAQKTGEMILEYERSHCSANLY